jgi:hypothetical protein
VGKQHEDAILQALLALGLATASDAIELELLSRADLSRAYKVRLAGRSLFVKASGNAAAVDLYRQTATHHVPDFRPKTLGFDAHRNILVEEWLDPEQFKSLAADLLQQPASYGWSTPFHGGDDCDLEPVLHSVGETIGKIHSATAGLARRGDITQDSATRLMLPAAYWRLLRAQPRLTNCLPRMAEKSARVEPVLLHGCLSPSAVLFSLDQVAIGGGDHMASGDPAFDLAHMMAHLFLASVRQHSCTLLTSAGYFHGAYSKSIAGLDGPSIMYRAGPLAVAFMRALIEDPQKNTFLSDRDRQGICDFAEWWLGRRDYTLGQVRTALWFSIDGNDELWRAEFDALPRAND